MLIHHGPPAKIELERGNNLQIKLPSNAIVNLHTDDFFNFMYGSKRGKYKLKRGRGSITWLNRSEAGFSINNVDFVLGIRVLRIISKRLGVEEGMKTVNKMLERVLRGKSPRQVLSEATFSDVTHYFRRHPELLKIRALVSALEDRRHPKKGLFAGTVGAEFGVPRSQARNANVKELFLMIVDHAEYELDGTDVRTKLNGLLLKLESMWLRSSLPQEIGDVEDVYELEGLMESECGNSDLEEAVVLSKQGYARMDGMKTVEIGYVDRTGDRKRAFIQLDDLRTICKHFFGPVGESSDADPEEVVMFHRRKKK